MGIVTSTGEVVSRDSMYAASATQHKKPRRQRRRNLSAQKPKQSISERQAKAILDRQIARRLRQMFY